MTDAAWSVNSIVKAQVAGFPVDLRHLLIFVMLSACTAYDIVGHKQGVPLATWHADQNECITGRAYTPEGWQAEDDCLTQKGYTIEVLFYCSSHLRRRAAGSLPPTVPPLTRRSCLLSAADRQAYIHTPYLIPPNPPSP
ncbi:MAG: hypothetical protein AB8B51_10715 [Sedimentitalea sp.]